MYISSSPSVSIRFTVTNIPTRLFQNARTIAYTFAALSMLLVACSSAKPSASPADNYREQNTALSKRMTAALKDLQSLTEKPRLDDPTWRDKLTATVNSMGKVRLDWRALTPPDEFALAYQSTLSALDAFMSACTNLQAGLATNTSASIIAGRNDITRGTAFLEAAIVQMPK